MSEIEQVARLTKIVDDLYGIGDSQARAAAFVFLAGMFDVDERELRHARRIVAKTTHPDTVAEEHRAEATVRMSAVNVAVDAAISETKDQP